MAVRLCPRCGKPVKKGEKCLKCDTRSCKRPNHGTRTAEQERARNVSEKWRKDYSSSVYQQNRQRVCARQNGCCARCGKPVATFRAGKWYTGKYGGIHHVNALSQGGSNTDVNNLVLLCTQCHNQIDAERRRELHK